MIAVLLSVALAQEPTGPWTVTSPELARFELQEPAAYGMRGDHPVFRSGWLARLEVPAGSLTQRAVATPSLHVELWPARVLHGPDPSCVVAWFPDVGDIGDARVFLGPTVLPERITEESARAAAQGATSVSRPFQTPPGPALALENVDAVWDLAREMLDRCQPATGALPQSE